jgi:TM2 domain-containing membrane protein YozV
MLKVEKRTIPHYPKNFVRAILLCWILGIFGIHRFYKGYKRIGFIQLITLGGFGIWWLIDLVSMCFNSYKDKYGTELEEYNGYLASLILSGTVILMLSVFILSIPVALEKWYS